MEMMKKQDMKHQKCTKCKKGVYAETSVHDDWEGVLHCDKCGHKIVRYRYAMEKI